MKIRVWDIWTREVNMNVCNKRRKGINSSDLPAGIKNWLPFCARYKPADMGSISAIKILYPAADNDL